MQQNITTPDELEQVLFKNRGIKLKSDQEEFLNPLSPLQLSAEAVGLDLKSLKRAVDRLIEAKENKELIIIYGDYDADGMSATAIAWRVLNDLGWKVFPFIPQRQKHGYGLSRAGVEELLKQYQPKIILTVDNGIVAHSEVEWIKEQKIEVIITDHHQPEMNKSGQIHLPSTEYLVHTNKLCGATVVWMLLKALVETIGQGKALLRKQLDLCGLATLADQVKLSGANRSFAKFGLLELAKTERVGLKQIYKLAEVEAEKISAAGVGFVIAPRINAVGRMAHGLKAVRLLCTQNQQQAQVLARELDQLNLQRQDLVFNLIELAHTQALDQSEQKLLFISGNEYNEGVIGLVAGKLCDQFYKPCIVASIMDGKVKGSARSIKGVNITEFLRQSKSLLTSVGGHPAAAGFSTSKKNLAKLKSKLQKLANEQIDPHLLQPKRHSECRLTANLLNLKTVALLEKFEPFGIGNPRPTFEIGPVEIVKIRQFGKANNHREFTIKLPDSANTFNIISWNHQISEELNDGSFLLVKLDQQTWQNNKRLSIIKV